MSDVQTTEKEESAREKVTIDQVYSNARNTIVFLQRFNQTPLNKFKRLCKSLVELYSQFQTVRETIEHQVHYEQLVRLDRFCASSYLELATVFSIESVFPWVYEFVYEQPLQDPDEPLRMEPDWFLIKVLSEFHENVKEKERTKLMVAQDRKAGRVLNLDDLVGPAHFYKRRRISLSRSMREEIDLFWVDFNGNGKAQFLYKSLLAEEKEIGGIEPGQVRPFLGVTFNILYLIREGVGQVKLTEQQMTIFIEIWKGREGGVNSRSVKELYSGVDKTRQRMQKKLMEVGLTIDTDRKNWFVRQIKC